MRLETGQVGYIRYNRMRDSKSTSLEMCRWLDLLDLLSGCPQRNIECMDLNWMGFAEDPKTRLMFNAWYVLDCCVMGVRSS